MKEENIDKKIKKQNKEVKSLEIVAKKHFTIKKQDDLVKASDFLAKVKNKLKELETERKEYTTPLNQTLRKLNNTFKELTNPLEDLEKQVKEAINTFRKKEEEKKLEKEKELKTGKDNLSLETTIPDVIESNEGEIRTVRNWTFEVIEENKIPRKYLTIDKKKISDDIKAGARKIKGLKIFQDINTSFYSKKEN